MSQLAELLMSQMAELFMDLCKKGNLDLIKNMVKKHNNINIHYCSEAAFKEVCISNHLHILKYLVSLYKIYDCYPINIYIDRNFGFRHACYHNNINIVKYLIKLHRINKIYNKINIYDESLYGDCMKEYKKNNKRLIYYLYNLGIYNLEQKPLFIL